jgi:hypothetical protein
MECPKPDGVFFIDISSQNPSEVGHVDQLDGSSMADTAYNSQTSTVPPPSEFQPSHTTHRRCYMITSNEYQSANVDITDPR